jgi:hypothetical protein
LWVTVPFPYLGDNTIATSMTTLFEWKGKIMKALLVDYLLGPQNMI